MSGSKSSPQDAALLPAEGAHATGDEALAFTVHTMPQPATGSRVLAGRLRMFLVLLACAAPVLASYFTYYVIRPDGRTNYASLIQPSRAMPDNLGLRTLQGDAVEPRSLRGQWLLISAADGACAAECEKRLYSQRQLREMMGREKDRLDKIWLITDAAAPRPELIAALQSQGEAMRVLRVDASALETWLQPAPGHALQDHLYVVDPMGEWMMRAPAPLEPSKFKRDLSKLLRASGFWDVPGR
jgi:hypothetical protein